MGMSWKERHVLARAENPREKLHQRMSPLTLPQERTTLAAPKKTAKPMVDEFDSLKMKLATARSLTFRLSNWSAANQLLLWSRVEPVSRNVSPIKRVERKDPKCVLRCSKRR
jgi:hypothetical protein